MQYRLKKPWFIKGFDHSSKLISRISNEMNWRDGVGDMWVVLWLAYFLFNSFVSVFLFLFLFSSPNLTINLFSFCLLPTNVPKNVLASCRRDHRDLSVCFLVHSKTSLFVLLIEDSIFVYLYVKIQAYNIFLTFMKLQ